MTKSFLFETLNGDVLDIELCISARSPDDNGYVESSIESVYIGDGVPFDLAILDGRDRDRLDRRIHELESELKGFAAQEYLEGLADFYHDHDQSSDKND